MDNGGKEPLRIDRFYTGFRRDDKRGWLGFHDGISTLKYTDRTQAVFVNRNNLNNDDSMDSQRDISFVSQNSYTSRRVGKTRFENPGANYW